MIINDFNGFFADIFCDKRLKRRAEKVMHDMLIFGKVVVNKFCTTLTDKIGAYRMFNNDSYDYKDLLKALYRFCIGNDRQESHLLCVQDTTEINWSHHQGRLQADDKDLGLLTKQYCVGFFCHPMLVIDAHSKIPVGFSSVELWNRKMGQPDKHERQYATLSIQEKESYRWISSAQRSKRLLSKGSILTIIADRESDIYEEFVMVPDARTHLLIRSKSNRRLYGSQKKLYERFEDITSQYNYELDIKGHKGRTARKAVMSLKYTQVRIQRPDKLVLKCSAEYIKLWAIEAKEQACSVPDGESPILWRLLTTHEITNIEQAKTCIQWYAERWLIEELFRVIKSKGFELESAQMETGAALKKLTVMTLQLALTTMVLKLSIENKENQPAELIFNKEQLMLMQLLLSEIEGKTKKQKNPYPVNTIAWASWNIARLGSWSGYKSHGPPGYITIKMGLDRFLAKYQGFKTALRMINEDVYKD